VGARGVVVQKKPPNFSLLIFHRAPPSRRSTALLALPWKITLYLLIFSLLNFSELISSLREKNPSGEGRKRHNRLKDGDSNGDVTRRSRSSYETEISHNPWRFITFSSHAWIKSLQRLTQTPPLARGAIMWQERILKTQCSINTQFQVHSLNTQTKEPVAVLLLSHYTPPLAPLQWDPKYTQSIKHRPTRKLDIDRQKIMLTKSSANSKVNTQEHLWHK
jgi:hypothetical protein